jgi:hypothetical protein
MCLDLTVSTRSLFLASDELETDVENANECGDGQCDQ